jgi:hypothetical protein
MKLRLALVAAACLLVAAVAFVLLHSGARGNATCERLTFVGSGEFSAWPPGARCSYGLPVRTDVVVNDWFFMVVGLLVLGLFVAHAWITGGAGDRRRRCGRVRHVR